jgi:lipopolysaccharide export LptBFGC system permease protein LptF
LLALFCVLIAAVISVSKAKGQLRLMASILVAAGFILGSLLQMVSEKRLWPGSLGVVAGVFLAWIGLRKYRRDPDGRTPSRLIL